MNTVALWHEISRGREMDRLEEVLAENCVFMSPVVHTPQKGRELTRAYLTAAFGVFNDSFRYVKEVVTPQHAVLEFVCDLDGIVINGVDIMTFDDAGKIVEFKVMVRPLKAVNLLHTKMKAMLEHSQGNKTGF
ncbi:MAG: nuclear transport factor 2 family protein [Halioglobus sp.]